MLVNETDSADLVVLLHGFAAGWGTTWPLALRLRHQGFRVQQWRYCSLFRSIDTHAARLRQHLVEELAHESRVHLVAHSMGTQVVRAALADASPPNLGRLVMLAPPNRGAPLLGAASLLLGCLFKPTRQLAPWPSSYVNRLPTNLPCEVGIIASWLDGIVPVPYTRLHSAKEHQTILATHNSLLLTRCVSDRIGRFLRSGSFD